MSWQDRTREAAYTSPGGQRFVFPYLTANRAFDKNTTAYNFAGVKGTYVQDLGNTDRRFPMRVIFWGDDHDQQADAFEAAINEAGRGKLEHPRAGIVDVVPFGTITIREDLVESANQTIIELEFFETTAELFPTGNEDAIGAVLNSVSAANGASAASFADGINTETTLQRTSLRDRLDATIGAARDGLETISSTETSVLRQFTAIADSLQVGLDTFISQPLALAQQTQALIQTPAGVAGSIREQLDTFGRIVSDLTDGNDPVRATVNEFKSDELFVMGAVNASIQSAISNEFTTRPEAVMAAEQIVMQFDKANDWREQNYSGIGAIDTGESYAALQGAVSIASGYLVSLSFSLLQERRVVLGRSRTMVDLVAELYCELDERFDFFIQTNDLSGDEFIEIPAGREVVYYK